MILTWDLQNETSQIYAQIGDRLKSIPNLHRSSFQVSNFARTSIGGVHLFKNHYGWYFQTLSKKLSIKSEK